MCSALSLITHGCGLVKNLPGRQRRVACDVHFLAQHPPIPLSCRPPTSRHVTFSVARWQNKTDHEWIQVKKKKCVIDEIEPKLLYIVHLILAATHIPAVRARLV